MGARKRLSNMKLFSENLGLARTNTELINLQNKYPKYDPGYICQSAGLPRIKEKKWMEKLWEKYEPYADSSFSEEFKYHFAQRSWELYLGATLLNRGFTLGQHNNNGPDFDIQDGKGRRLAWVEAITKEKGNGSKKVPDMIENASVDFPEEKIVLRISYALDDKFKKYCGYLTKNIVKDNEPYIIAVNRSRLDYFDPELPLILKAHCRPSIGNQNDKDGSILFFKDANHAGVSAVIYCKDGILDSPQLPKEMGKNFIVVHNPLAKNPLPSRFFSFGDKY